jgi:hypothetical protein
MLWVISSIKLLAEIGLLALLGRGVLRLWLARLHPHQSERNVFLKLLDALSAPWLWLAQAMSPRVVVPAHWVWVAVALAAFLWLVATTVKIWFCVQTGLEACQ